MECLDYVIPVFTKVDESLKKRGEKDFLSYEKQERSIHEELAKDGLQTFNEKIIKKIEKSSGREEK